MTKRFLTGMLVLILAVSFSTVSFAQEKMQKEAKKEDKMEMSKTEKGMGPLKSVTCDPACGFMCRSHSEKELTAIVKDHAKKMHKMELTDKKIKEMMKTEEGSK